MNKGFQYINLEYLEMMSGDDTDMQKEMLGILITEVENEVPKMKHHIQKQEWKDLKDVSHKFKSTAAFLGNELMTDANHQIETIAKSQTELEKLPELFAIIEHLYPQVHADLQKAIQSL